MGNYRGDLHLEMNERIPRRKTQEVSHEGDRKYKVSEYRVDLSYLPEVKELQDRMAKQRKEFSKYLRLQMIFDGMCALILCLEAENERLRDELTPMSKKL